MILKITNNKLISLESFSIDRELRLEDLISDNENSYITNFQIFGEELLIIGKEIPTRDKKRADIVCLDKFGNIVIVELKKDQAKIGIETQALQYLADLSKYKGRKFIERFSKEFERNTNVNLEETLKSFLELNVSLESLNQSQSIILIARSFDQSLFSMGEWLALKGVPFKCIQYQLYTINSEEFISFSIVFDQISEKSRSLKFSDHDFRSPTSFWFNIGFSDQSAWDLMTRNHFISAGFEGIPEDRGHQILKSFIPNDTIVAFSSQRGVVGIGKVTENSQYNLVERNSPQDYWNGKHLHRLTLNWEELKNDINEAIKTSEIKIKLGLFHPIQTKQSFPLEKLNDLKRLFSYV